MIRGLLVGLLNLTSLPSQGTSIESGGTNDGLSSATQWSAVWDKLVEFLSYDPQSPLIFSSGMFLFVFTLFALFYALLRRNLLPRLIYVFAFSLYFYYKSSGIYFLLILVVATTDFFIGHRIKKGNSKGEKRWWVALSIAINLGLLGYFKYTNFFIGVGQELFGRDFMQFQNIFLPVGISFFIFQSISYTIDIYREKIEPLTNWLDYAFYLSFFPQVAAGPIVRAVDFIPQIRKNPVKVTREMFGMGIFLIVCGLFKKAVISDYISLNFVDRIFDNPTLYGGFENLMGVYGYALQIYCDFSGYSDMAIGIALILGFRFKKNFDSPYKSATITEFWRRWHMSLSSWLRDYLYISLGGNRKGRVRTYINLMITMLLGGLWHGAAIRFLLWGALHGAALAIHKLVMELFSSFKSDGAKMSRLRRAIGVLITFHLVCLGWILFRAPDMATAKGVIKQIFTNFDLSMAPSVVMGYLGVFSLIAIGYLLHFTPERYEKKVERIATKMPIAAMAGVIVAIIWVVMQIKSAEIQPFIYFQF